MTVGLPNITTGRVDADGNQRDFQKAFSVTAEVAGLSPVQETAWVIVTGNRPRAGTFVSFVFDEIPLAILRDPPGDGSYSFIEKGTTISATFKDINIEQEDGKISEAEILLGSNTAVGTSLGSGFANATLDWPLKLLLGVKETIKNTTLTANERGIEINLTTTERISTSSSEVFIGEDADVYIGIAPNFEFAKTDVLDIGNCEVVKTESIAAKLGDLEETRVYVYTGFHIRNFLIPQLLELSTSEDLDFAQQENAENSASNWTKILQSNRDAKNGAESQDSPVWMDTEFSDEDVAGIQEDFETIRSAELDGLVPFQSDDLNDHVPYQKHAFSAGVDYEFSSTFEKTQSRQWSKSVSKESVTYFRLEEEVIALSESVSTSVDIDFSETEETTTIEGETEAKIGYILSDNDVGDFISVDVRPDNQFGTPIFTNVLGTTSSPWEPWFKDPEKEDLYAVENLGTQRRSMVQMNVSAKEQLLVPHDEAAVFTLSLSNLSESGENRFYILEPIEEFNPGGAGLKINGRPMASLGGLAYEIVAGESQEVALTVDRGPSQAEFFRIGLTTYGEGELESKYDGVYDDDGNWLRHGDWVHHPGISDTIYVNVTFSVPCSEITMVRPRDGFLFNRTLQESGERDIIEVALLDFDMKVSREDSLEAVGAEFKLLGSEAFWFLANQVSRKQLLEETGDGASLDWDVSDLPDGVYELRAFA
ncbi:MAG: hypothetical protein QGG64_15710, partial [Candidatus Latescibacteria bacterium]|nr:hypothetical protein [Candidatus Latescibacterota bacterium]